MIHVLLNIPGGKYVTKPDEYITAFTLAVTENESSAELYSKTSLFYKK